MRDFYANVKQAGLRKAGAGTLVLKGKQFYTTDTQVLEGTLVLDNNSNSRYLVATDGTLKLGQELKVGEVRDPNAKILLANDILSNGITKLNKSVDMKDYYGSHASTLHLTTDTKLSLGELKTAGKIRLDLADKDLSIEEVNRLVTANKIDLTKTTFTNTFLTPTVSSITINDKKIERIEFVQTPEEITKRMKDLSKEESRNLASYDDNANKFFASYDHLSGAAYFPKGNPVGKIANYDPYFKEGDDRDEVPKKTPIFNQLGPLIIPEKGTSVVEEPLPDLIPPETGEAAFVDPLPNLSPEEEAALLKKEEQKVIKKGSVAHKLFDFEAESPDAAKEVLFTDHYSNIVTNELTQNLQIKDLIDKELMELSKQNRIKATNHVITNRLDDKKYSSLNYKTSGTRVIFNKIVNDNLEAFLGYGDFKGNGTFMNRFDEERTDYKTKNKAYNVGFKLKHKNAFMNYNALIVDSETEGHRNMQKEDLKYELDSRSINHTIGVGYYFNYGKLELTPYVDYTHSHYTVRDFKETRGPKNMEYATDISNNRIVKHNMSLALKAQYTFDKLSVYAIGKYDHNFNPDTKINTNTLGVNYEVNAQKIYRDKWEAQLGLNYMFVPGHKVGFSGFTNTNNRHGLEFMYEYTF